MTKNNSFSQLRFQHKEYIKHLKIILSIPILFLLSINNAHANQNQTEKDLLTLKNEITHLLKNGNKNPLQAALTQRRITKNFSDIAITSSEDDDVRKVIFPNERPIDITEDEWQALLKSNIDISDAENGNASLALLDLDEDGKRDLIIDIYNGGTGLFSYISVYKRIGNSFQSVAHTTNSSGELIDESLYSINGRGSDQQGEWIHINNRTYLAYRNGEYGQDQLVLLRAFDTNPKKAPAIEVNYRYHHQLLKQTKPKDTSKKTALLSPKLQAELQKQLNKVSLHNGISNTNIYGECPAPKGLSKEKKAQYTWPWFGAGHYTMDIVADFPVYDSTGCHAARLINFRSSYMENHEIQPTQLPYLDKPDDDTALYIEIKTTRLPINVKSIRLNSPSFEH